MWKKLRRQRAMRLADSDPVQHNPGSTTGALEVGEGRGSKCASYDPGSSLPRGRGTALSLVGGWARPSPKPISSPGASRGAEGGRAGGRKRRKRRKKPDEAPITNASRRGCRRASSGIWGCSPVPRDYKQHRLQVHGVDVTRCGTSIRSAATIQLLNGGERYRSRIGCSTASAWLQNSQMTLGLWMNTRSKGFSQSWLKSCLPRLSTTMLSSRKETGLQLS